MIRSSSTLVEASSLRTQAQSMRRAARGNGSLIERQLLTRTGVKRESRTRPTKNHVANLTPLRFLRYFNSDDSKFISGRILKRNVNVAVCFSFYSNYTARERKPFIFNPGAF